MLNILYATTSTSISGGTRQLINNAVGMAEAGHRITVCCFAGAKLIQELSGLENITLSIIEANSLLDRLSFFRHLLVTNNIHVVHCFHNKLYKYFLVLRFLCPPFKLFLNRGVIFAPGSFPLFYLPQLTGIICNSGAAADVLRKYHLPSKKLHVVYNAVIPEENVTTTRDVSSLTITYIGTKREYKGLDIFLKTVARLTGDNPLNAKFVVAGVQKNPQFEKIVPASILDRIEFTGSLPHTGIHALLARTDIFVITSRQESLPNTLLEAYAAGVPVISTAVGGIPEILVHGSNGYLCESENDRQIATCIEKLSKNSQKRAEMSSANQKFFCENFTIHAKTKKLTRIYNL